ncbi:uncharacterized protein LOC125683062 [Ostrea edulis]|uniref:uncharacterized protein LOC125683062 n=1 Tax=Ostrea edulis TaxID=37623 RepID=UPI002094F8FC|nr:uncharacterized protein LOC125683062 [Ostrea edulis]
MVKSGQVFTTAIVTESDFMKRAETLIEDLEEEKHLRLIIVVVVLGLIFAMVGAGLTMFWLCRKTNQNAYRRNRFYNLWTLRSTTYSGDGDKQNLV